jgi:UDP-N-acetylglucosamine 3-dehydrogenase
MIKYNIHKKEPLRLELEHFVNCVLNNTEPLVSGEDGLRALELANKIIESANKNEVIKDE